jgi:hypothetical protein
MLQRYILYVRVLHKSMQGFHGFSAVAESDFVRRFDAAVATGIVGEDEWDLRATTSTRTGP